MAINFDNDPSAGTVDISEENSPNNNNQAPTAINQTLNVFKNSEVSITLNGTDPEGTKLKFFLVGGKINKPKFGRIFIQQSQTFSTEIDLSVNNYSLLSGQELKLVYRPNQDQIGLDTIKFFVEDSPLDGSAPRVSLNASVSINIVEAENAPTENNQQIDEIETQEATFNLKPEAVLVADFKELFFAGENQQEQRTPSGFFLSESISRISLINSEIENYISDPIESQKQQINIFKNNINLKLAQEIDYLKLLNNSVFSALESTNFISVSNDGITTFIDNDSIIFNQTVNPSGVNSNYIDNFKNSIQPFDFISLLVDFGYNQNDLQNDIQNKLGGSLTKIFLFILENFKNSFKFHSNFKTKGSLDISENDFFSLKNFLANGSFSQNEIVRFNLLNISVFNQPNVLNLRIDNILPFFNKIDSFLNGKISNNKQDAIASLIIYVLNEFNFSKLADKQTAINNLKKFFPSSNQTNEFYLSNFFDNLFGSNNNSLNLINNVSLRENSLQKIAVNSKVSSENLGSGQINASIDNILSLEPHDVFINLSSNGIENIFTKTAKSEYISKSLKLNNLNFNLDNLNERISQLSLVKQEYQNLFQFLGNGYIFNNTTLNPFNFKNFSFSSDNTNNSLENPNNFILALKNLLFPDLNTSDPNLAFDDTLFLFGSASKSKVICSNLFLFCLYSALINANSLPQTHEFFNFRLSCITRIKNEFSLLFKTAVNLPVNLVLEKAISINSIEEIMLKDNTLLSKIIGIFTEIYKSTHLGSNSVLNTVENGSVLIASKSNTVLLFASLFFGLTNIFDSIFNITVLRRSVINNINTLIIQRKTTFSPVNINAILSKTERDAKIKLKSLIFVDKFTKNIINSYENLKNILSTANVQTGFKEGISSINNLFENNQQGLSNAVQNLILNDNNIDKSVKNFEYIKNKISAFESGFIFDSIYELSKLGSSRFLEIFEKTFRNSEFLDTDEFFNRKIISIGLPAGFLNNVKTQKSNNSSQTTSKNANIIKIRVFKTDLRFPEIILKPKEFYFECSRYIDESRLSEIDITQFLEKMPMINFIRGSIILKTDRSVEDTFDPAVHAFLTPAQKKDIIKNHSLDYFTKVYLRLLNNSTRHFIDDNLSLLNISNGFNKNDINAFINLTNPVIQHVAQNLNLPQTDLDNIRFNVFNSFLDLNGEITKIRDYIYFPKKFDRIFNIVIDPNSFEVDYENTIEINFPNGEQDFEIFEQEIGIININNTKKIPSESPISSSRTVFDRYIFDIELL